MKTLAPLLAALALAACVNVLPKAPPPSPRFLISAVESAAREGPQIDWTLVIEDPQASRVYDTTKIALAQEQGRIEFYANGEWADRAPRLLVLALGLLARARDLVAQHPDLLEAWRPLAKDFDIFFGLEAATDEGLAGLVKDTTVDRTAQAVEVSRGLGYGVTGNFVIDPDWDEADFEKLWAFVETLRLGRAGYTVLTALPGTPFYEASRPRLRGERRAAFRAEASVHEVAAVRRAHIVCERSFDLHLVAREEDIHGAGARADILAVAAPAMPRRDRLGVDRVTQRAAAASAGDGHCHSLHRNCRRPA